jgi:hypothetical protein
MVEMMCNEILGNYTKD